MNSLENIINKVKGVLVLGDELSAVEVQAIIKHLKDLKAHHDDVVDLEETYMNSRAFTTKILFELETHIKENNFGKAKETIFARRQEFYHSSSMVERKIRTLRHGKDCRPK